MCPAKLNNNGCFSNLIHLNGLYYLDSCTAVQIAFLTILCFKIRVN